MGVFGDMEHIGIHSEFSSYLVDKCKLLSSQPCFDLHQPERKKYCMWLFSCWMFIYIVSTQFVCSDIDPITSHCFGHHHHYHHHHHHQCLDIADLTWRPECPHQQTE